MTRDLNGDGKFDLVIKSCSKTDGEAHETSFYPCKNDVWPINLDDAYLHDIINLRSFRLCNKYATPNARQTTVAVKCRSEP